MLLSKASMNVLISGMLLVLSERQVGPLPSGPCSTTQPHFAGSRGIKEIQKVLL